MKLIVTGYARHGKDTVCEILKKLYGLQSESSSKFANELVVFPKLKELYGYKTPEECFADRFNHRAEWFNLIFKYNYPDRTKLARELFAKYDIYCGLRNIEELRAIKKSDINPITIWVDASKRKPPESKKSMTITKQDCLYILDNNGSLKDLERSVIHLYEMVIQFKQLNEIKSYEDACGVKYQLLDLIGGIE